MFSKGFKGSFILFLLCLTVIFIQPSLFGSTSSKEKIKLNLYIMSQCPYGTATENTIFPLLKEFGDQIDFNLDFIASENKFGTFNSLHGKTEVDGDLVQICAQKYEPLHYLDLITAMNQHVETIPGNWSNNAQDLNLNLEPIRRCADGDEGKKLLSESSIRSKKASATVCPTILINGRLYDGDRETADFRKAFCYAFTNDWPTPCHSLAKPVKIKAIILGDVRCGEDCAISRIINSLRKDFPGISFQEIDYSTPEGKKLYLQTKITNLPAILFDKTIKKGEGYTNVEKFLVKAGKYQSLKIQASFNPTKTICDETTCDKPECKDNIKCRVDTPNTLELFVMSDEQFAKKATRLLHVLAFDHTNQFNFDIHYIAGLDTNGSFTSFNGAYEAEEDLVQESIKNISKDKLINYLFCRNKKRISGTDWQECAGEVGLDISNVISFISNGGAAKMLSNDIALSAKLKIIASPTWLVNNRSIFYGLDQEAILSNFCKHNPSNKMCAVSETDTNTSVKNAIDFYLYDLQDKRVSLSDFKGKKIFLNFWNSRCSPCKEEMPDIQKVFETNKDIVILAVNMGERSDWVKAFVNTAGYRFPILLDQGKSVADLYNVLYTPTSLFINSDGTIYKRFDQSLNQKEIEEAIRGLR